MALAFLGPQSGPKKPTFLAEKKITHLIPPHKKMSGRDWWWIEMSFLFLLQGRGGGVLEEKGML